MGIHLCIQTLKCKDHPEWDCGSHAGDRDFASMRHSLPMETTGDVECTYERPSNFAAWRDAITKIDWPNPGRHERMLDILEKNPSYWLYVSY